MSLYSVKVSLKLRAGVAQRPIFAGCFARNYQANLQYKIDASKLTEKRFSSYSDIREEKSSIDT